MPIKLYKIAAVLFCSIFLLSMSGCSSDDGLNDLREFTKEIEAKPKGKIKPLPEFQAYEAFTYSAAGQRSPFDKPVDIKIIQQQALFSNVTPDDNRPTEYLEAFNIESIKMVGTLQNSEGSLWALVEDGDGGIHQVIVGQYLGRNHGKIIGISISSIEVMEIVPNGKDSWIERPRLLALKEKE